MEQHREEAIKAVMADKLVTGQLPETPKRPPEYISISKHPECPIMECGWNRGGYCEGEGEECE